MQQPDTQKLEKILALYVHESGKLYRPHQNKLMDELETHLTPTQLKDLYAELRVQSQGLGRSAEIRHLIQYLNRRSQATKLVKAFYLQHPDISWLEADEVNPTKLYQAMSNAYDQTSLTNLCQSLIAEYKGRYFIFISYDKLKGTTVSEKIKFLIEWHRFDYPNFWDKFINQVLQDHPGLSDQITFGSVPYSPN